MTEIVIMLFHGAVIK